MTKQLEDARTLAKEKANLAGRSYGIMLTDGKYYVLDTKGNTQLKFEEIVDPDNAVPVPVATFALSTRLNNVELTTALRSIVDVDWEYIYCDNKQAGDLLANVIHRADQSKGNIYGPVSFQPMAHSDQRRTIQVWKITK